MLRLEGVQAECLFDEVLPERCASCPRTWLALDELLADPALLAPIEATGGRGEERGPRRAATAGRRSRWTTYVRLMVIKQRTGWGYETLVREVIGLPSSAPLLPDRAHRAGAGRVDGPQADSAPGRGDSGGADAAVIAKAMRERRFRARAVRIDSTVVEADVRYPTDAGLAADGSQGARAAGPRLAGESARGQRGARPLAGGRPAAARDLAARWRAGPGEAQAEVLRLTGEAGRLLAPLGRGGPAARERLRAACARPRRPGQAQRRERARASWPSAARRSPSRSANAWPASRSPTGSSPSPIPTRGRSARASRASRPSSATSPRSPRSRRTPNRGQRASSCRPQAGPGNLGENHSAHDRRRASATRPGAAGDRSRRRLRPPSLRGATRRARTGPGLRLRPPRTGLGANQAAIAPLPNRDRGPDLPPQARLRAEAVEVEGTGGPAHLDSLGDPGL